MPRGVMPACSRFTITTPLEKGSMPQMHSKQPQEVMGSSMIEYRVTLSRAPWLYLFTASLTSSQRPTFSSMTLFLGTIWQGPEGSSSLVALASSQLTAPHRPRRSGVTMHTWLGEKD